MSQKGFDNFDEFAKDYRQIHNENIKLSGADSDYFSEYKVIEIKNREKANRVDRVLDLGCGDGNSCRFFRNHLPNAALYGIDVSEDSVEQARKREIPNAFFSGYDGTHIPYEDKFFDVVLIATVMHHIRFEYHEALMQEVFRVTKPGGHLYIFEHNPWNPVTRHMVNTCPFDKDAILLSPTYCKKLVKSAGFNPVKNHYTLFFPRSGAFKPFLGLEPALSWAPIGGQYYTFGVKPF